MTLLCIETSTHVCSAALCKDGVVVEQCIERADGNHARLLPQYIEQLLQLAQEKNLPIEAVALSEGPGSYTGLRIGASTAKGLCYGLNVPLIPIPTLEILCTAAREHSAFRIPHSALLCPMIDARRMEVYTTDENYGARAVVVENEDSLISGEKEVYYFGDGAAKCQAVLTKPNWHYIPDIVPEAKYIGQWVNSHNDKELKVINGADLAYYEPFYLKEFVAAQSHVKGLK